MIPDRWAGVDRADEYLQHAEQMELKAAHAPTALIKQQFIEIAQSWRDLAEQVRRPRAIPPTDQGRGPG